MALGHFDRPMPEQDRHIGDIHTFEEQLDGEGISEAMRVSIWQLGVDEELPQGSLPAGRAAL